MYTGPDGFLSDGCHCSTRPVLSESERRLRGGDIRLAKDPDVSIWRYAAMDHFELSSAKHRQSGNRLVRQGRLDLARARAGLIALPATSRVFARCSVPVSDAAHGSVRAERRRANGPRCFE